jgi:hypothetical protein
VHVSILPPSRCSGTAIQEILLDFFLRNALLAPWHIFFTKRLEDCASQTLSYRKSIRGIVSRVLA